MTNKPETTVAIDPWAQIAKLERDQASIIEGYNTLRDKSHKQGLTIAALDKALMSALSWITVNTETSAANAEDMRETEHKRAYLCDELRAALSLAHGKG